MNTPILFCVGVGAMSPRVVITEWIDPDIVEFLSRSFEVVPNMTGKSLSRQEVLRRAHNAQAVIVFPSDVIDGDFLDSCPDLVIVAGTFDGLGQVDVQACTYRGVWVTNVSGLVTASIGSVELEFTQDGEGRTAVLEAAANIFEAFLEERPKRAVNSPHRRLKPKQTVHAPLASSS